MEQLNDFTNQRRGKQIIISDTNSLRKLKRRQDYILLQIKEVVSHHLIETVHLI